MSGFGLAGPPPAPSISGWKHLRTGKVRDLYSNEKNQILLVASDRISAYDWVMPTDIPGKGIVLTQLSLFWFELLEEIVPNHIISTDVPNEVEGRAVIVEPLKMFEIECVARGYLAGSGWSEYLSNNSICGHALPSGLLDGSKLSSTIFTPATKADIGGHDINIDFETTIQTIGREDATRLKDLTIKLFETAAEYAQNRGIILADTKFEFGTNSSGQILLGDEALTPDSSRFWELSTWMPGGAQASFDKQFLRDYLVSSGWDRNSQPPELPREIVEKTAGRYSEAFYRLTGKRP